MSEVTIQVDRTPLSNRSAESRTRCQPSRRNLLWARLVLGACAGVLSLACFPAFPQRAPAHKQPNPMTREDVQRGRAQFQQTCAMCHGTEAKGGSEGPDLIESSLVRHDQNGDLIGKLLEEGRVSKGMPAFPSLSKQQVADIVAFLHASVEVADNRGSGGPATGLSLNQLLTGNVEAGQQFFNGQGKCSTCHSPSGDLAGIAKKYSPLQLEGRFLYPSSDTQEAVVTLPSGEKIKGKVLHLDAFYVALLDANGEYRSWFLRSGVKVDLQDPLREHRMLLESYQDKDIHNVFAYLETLH